MKWQRCHLLFLIMAVLGGCATMPTGPSVMVMPGPGKPFEVFAEVHQTPVAHLFRVAPYRFQVWAAAEVETHPLA